MIGCLLSSTSSVASSDRCPTSPIAQPQHTAWSSDPEYRYSRSLSAPPPIYSASPHHSSLLAFALDLRGTDWSKADRPRVIVYLTVVSLSSRRRRAGVIVCIAFDYLFRVYFSPETVSDVLQLLVSRLVRPYHMYASIIRSPSATA